MSFAWYTGCRFSLEVESIYRKSLLMKFRFPILSVVLFLCLGAFALSASELKIRGVFMTEANHVRIQKLVKDQVEPFNGACRSLIRRADAA